MHRPVAWLLQSTFRAGSLNVDASCSSYPCSAGLHHAQPHLTHCITYAPPDQGWAAAQAQAAIVHDRCHEALYTGHYKDVPLVWQATYRFACHLQCLLAVLRLRGPSVAALRAADMGVMMGAPLLDMAHGAAASAAARAMDLPALASALQRELSARHTGSAAAALLETAVRQPSPPLFTPADLRRVARVRLPTLEGFAAMMARGLPVVIEGAVDHWPAMERWRDMAYLKVPQRRHRRPCFSVVRLG